MSSSETTKPTGGRQIAPPRELAHRIALAIRSQRVAAGFIENYARQYDRPEFTLHEERNRELQIVLEREILLAISAHVTTLAEESARVSRTKRTGKRSAVGDPARFAREFVAGIGAELRWTAGDVVEFRGELNLYRAILAAGAAKASGIPRSFRRSIAAGPFVDRCAFLLDPSMMENARQAAAKLLHQMEALAERHFDEVLKPPREGTLRR
jgi:hypothetical protein